MINKVVGLYFSPSGDTARLTKRVAEEIAARMDASRTSLYHISICCAIL